MSGDIYWNSAALEPKKSYKFFVTFGDSKSGLKDYVVANVTLPNFSVGEITVPHLDATYYYPGRVTWEPVTLTTIDTVSDSAAKKLFDLLKKSGYTLPDERATGSRYAVLGKSTAVSAINGQVTITQTNNAGEATHTWKLMNCYISGVEFGNQDYAGEDLVNVTITLRYDWAVIDKKAGANASTPT
jgi:hypothetical protein